MEINKELFLKAKNEMKPILFKNFINENPSWDSFIKALDYKYHYNYTNTENRDQGFVVNNNNQKTDILMNNVLDPKFWYAISSEFYTNENSCMKFFPEVKILLNKLNPAIGDLQWVIKGFLNLVSYEKNTYAHKDSQDVLSWSCQGSVEYRIFEEFDSEYYVTLDVADKQYISYILEPGDLMFVPAGLIHQAIIIEPRASLIMDLEF